VVLRIWCVLLPVCAVGAVVPLVATGRRLPTLDLRPGPIPVVIDRLQHGRLVDAGGAAGADIRPSRPERCGGLNVVRSPDRRSVAFTVLRPDRHAIGHHVFVLKVMDLGSGRTRRLAVGACSLAWSRFGLAWVQGRTIHIKRSFTTSFRGRVMVLAPGASRPVAWAPARRWDNLIWAGPHLLVSHETNRSPNGELTLLDGPGHRRSVDGSARHGFSPSSAVVAVSPDGARAVLDTQGAPSAGPARLTLLRVADDAVLSTARFAGGLEAAAPDGDWLGSRIVATDGYLNGGTTHPPPRLIVMHVRGNRLFVDREYAFTERGYRILGQSMASTSAPQLLDASAHRVLLSYLPYWGAHVRVALCRRLVGRCSEAPFRGQRLRNPSRPSGP
jgi:hypothetical protein